MSICMIHCCMQCINECVMQPFGSVCVCVYVYVCVCMCVYVYVCVCMCVYVYVFTPLHSRPCVSLAHHHTKESACVLLLMHTHHRTPVQVSYKHTTRSGTGRGNACIALYTYIHVYTHPGSICILYRSV